MLLTRVSHISLLTLFLAPVFSGCLGNDLGIQGGSSILAKKFAGIEAIEILSPTAVKVKWANQSDYLQYSVFISTSDSPIKTSTFDSAIIDGLSPSTTYLLSVSGKRKDGSEVGASKSLSVTTWTPFAGASSAQAIDFSSIRVNWTFVEGPTYKIYRSAGVPVADSALLGVPDFTSGASSGFVASGLASNTLYYFSVVAQYADGTTSLPSSVSASSGTVPGQFTTSQLASLPTVSASTDVIVGSPITVTVSGAPFTWQTKVYNGALIPGNLVATLNGSQSVAISSSLPIGTHALNYQITDTLSALQATGVLADIRVLATVAPTVVPMVSAMTSTALDPIPFVTGPSVSLGRFPTFQVTGALPGYTISIYKDSTFLGSRTGDGPLTVLPSAPLAAGANTVVPKASYLGETATLSAIAVRVKALSDLPQTPAVSLEQGEGGRLGEAVATGDFNCDGYPDLAAGAAHGDFTRQEGTLYGPNIVNYNESAGAVAVFYGGPSGLDLSAVPVTSPAAGKPLLIPYPGPNTQIGITAFGRALAVGNFNNDLDTSTGTRPCQDLAIGAPSRAISRLGGVYVYYGSTGVGLANATVATPEAFSCAMPNSANCQVQLFEPTVPALQIAGNANTGLGWSLAVGDINGDGVDDLAASHPGSIDPITGKSHGAIRIYDGTAFGLSGNFRRILLPNNASFPNVGANIGWGLTVGKFSNAAYADIAFTVHQISNVPFGGVNTTGIIWVKGGAALNNPATRDANGSLVMPNGNDWVYIPVNGIGNAAWSMPAVMASGDLNRDGYAEIIASFGTYDGSNGRVLIYYGSAANGPKPHQLTVPTANNLTCAVGQAPGVPNQCPPQIFNGPFGFNYIQYGQDIGKPTDLNGDSYPDLMVGMPGLNANASAGYVRNGEVIIYYSSDRGLSPSPYTRVRPQFPIFSMVGLGMAAADFNNDSPGRPDLAIGSPGQGNIAGTYRHGRVSIFGNSVANPILPGSVLTQANITGRTPHMPSLRASTLFSRAQIVGDLNGDGYDDVIAPIRAGKNVDLLPFVYSGGSYGSYKLAVFYGSPGGLVTSSSTCPAAGEADCAPKPAPLDPLDPLLITFETLSNLEGYWYLQVSPGTYASPAGDVNGDGFADIVVGHPSMFSWIYYGFSTGLITQPGPLELSARGTAIDPQILQDNTGYLNHYIHVNVGGAGEEYDPSRYETHGDFNGDGFSDYAVVVRGYGGNGGSSASEAILQVYSGSAQGVLKERDSLYPTSVSYGLVATYSQIHFSPDCPGGLCRPLGICIRNTTLLTWCDGTWPGGPTDVLNPPGTGPSATSVQTIQNVGDVNGDGVDDLAMTYRTVGESTNYPNTVGVPTPVADAGRVYLFYGRRAPSGNPGADQGLSGARWVEFVIQPQFVASAAGRIPYSLSAGGDINGDGLRDFAVGYNSEAAGYAGANIASGGDVVVIHGLNGGYNSLRLQPGVTCSGAAGNDYLPCVVQISAVDNNPAINMTADYDPLKIVDMVDNACNPTTNQCNVLRIIERGQTLASRQFGLSVNIPGDLNGDGYADLLAARLGDAARPDYLYAFFGTANGLNSNTTSSVNPSCSASGGCNPMRFEFARNGTVTYSGYFGGAYRLMFAGWTGSGDIDGDGTPDTLIGTRTANMPGGAGYYTGGFYILK